MWGIKCTIASVEGEIWFVLADEARRHCLKIGRLARAEINRIMERGMFLKTVVRADDERALRFIHFLGFSVDYSATTRDWDGQFYYVARKAP